MGWLGAAHLEDRWGTPLGLSGPLLLRSLPLSEEAAEGGRRPPSPSPANLALLRLLSKRIFFLPDAATVCILNRQGDEKKRGPVRERRVCPCATIVGGLLESR